MKDPERLADVDASALARRMLTAARDETPSNAAFDRTVAALGVGAVIVGAGASAGIAAAGAAASAGANAVAAGMGGTALSGATKLAPAGLMIAAAKWVGIGAASGLLTAGVVDRVSTWDAPEPSSPVQKAAPTVSPGAGAAVPARAKAREVRNEVTETDEVETPGVKQVAPRAALVQPAPQEAAARRARLAAEVEAVDRAREAVARGNAAQALQALDAYERGFSEQRLRPEALYLRMEAFVQRGDVAGARSAAAALLAADPRGPHAARARAVLAPGP
jgi:hypothetical protein